LHIQLRRGANVCANSAFTTFAKILPPVCTLLNFHRSKFDANHDSLIILAMVIYLLHLHPTYDVYFEIRLRSICYLFISMLLVHDILKLLSTDNSY